MSTDELRGSVMAALSRVMHPRSGQDLVSAGHVQNLEVGEDGEVRFAFLLRPEDPGDLVKVARGAVEGIPGVSSVKINVSLPQAAAAGGGGGHGGLQPGSVPAPTPQPQLLQDVEHVV